MTTPHTMGGRAIAIAMGLVCAAGSLMLLLGDAWMTPAAWSIDQRVMVITVVIAVGAGHLMEAARASRRWLAAAGFLILFIACTALVVDKSVGRQAISKAGATASAEAVNTLRANKLAELATTRARLRQAEEMADAERAGRPDARGKRTTAAACGRACQDWTRRADEVRSHLAALERELAAIGPERKLGADVEQHSKLAALFGADPDRVRHLHPLLIPFATTLAMEIGVIVCLGYGLSGGRRQRRQPASPAPATGGGPGNPATQPVAELPDNVLSFRDFRPVSGPETRKLNSHPVMNSHPVLAALAQAGRPLTNRELAERMGVTEGEASKRVAEIADHLEIVRQGRWKMIAVRQMQQAAM